MSEHLKINVATQAAREIVSGTVLGLGSGTTAECFLHALAQRIDGEGLKVCGLATSHRTQKVAIELHIPLICLEASTVIDVCVDGVDEYTAQGFLIKGHGGALLREKIVFEASRVHWILAQKNKYSEFLGAQKSLPIEIIPFGAPQTLLNIENVLKDSLQQPVTTTLRVNKGGDPYVSDGGHWIVDCDTGPLVYPHKLALALKSLTGVVDHGLFFLRKKDRIFLPT